MSKYTSGWERASTTGFFSAVAKAQADTTERNDSNYRAKNIARPLARSIMKAIGTAVNATPVITIGAHKMKTLNQQEGRSHLQDFVVKKLALDTPTYRGGPAPAA